jgi:CheY-like chemotaxis protein
VGAKTILLVEDEFIIRFTLADFLRDVGYQVVEAGDGLEGLDILNSGQRIDLMVTDVQMPGGVDGLELAIHSKRLVPSRPVVVCSAHMATSECYPADEFHSKPYALPALVALIEKLIGDPWQNSSQTRLA